MNHIRRDERRLRLAALWRVVVQGQTYRNLFYLLTSFPLGVGYLTLLAVMLRLSFGVALVIGIPLLVGLIAASWQIAAFERRLAMRWLRVDIPPMSYPVRADMPWWQKWLQPMRNPTTWKALVYLLLKFPFGVISFGATMMLVVSSSAIVLGPVTGLIGVVMLVLSPRSFRFADGVGAFGVLVAFVFVALLGIAVGLGSLHLINALAHVWGRFARVMLGMSETALRLMDAQETAERERAKAERADRSRHELIVNVSHELRTPIASIRGHVESLLIAAEESPPDLLTPADQRAYLGIIHRETERLSALVDDLLALARAEAGELRLEVGPVPAGEVVEEVYQTLAPLAYRERRVTLVRTVTPGLPAVLADRQRLGQVLLNLVRNAITYTPAGGLVSIMLAQADAGHLELTVADTGIGIPPEDLDRIFERFYRTDASRARSTGGFGLGLAIARDLIDAMGGTIDVESTVEQGTSFHVRLRAEAQRPAISRQPSVIS